MDTGKLEEDRLVSASSRILETAFTPGLLLSLPNSPVCVTSAADVQCTKRECSIEEWNSDP